MKNSESVSDENKLTDIDDNTSRIKSKLDNMQSYYAVPVNGREISKMRRIDREFMLYEEKKKNK